MGALNLNNRDGMEKLLSTLSDKYENESVKNIKNKSFFKKDIKYFTHTNGSVSNTIYNSLRNLNN